MTSPRSSFAALAATLLTLAALPHPASAQVTGTVIGTVKDAQGAVTPGATVTLVSEARGTTMETTTNAEGDFVFPNVTAGSYLIRVTMDGFKTVERPGIAVSPGDRVSVPPITIDVGAVNETVTVRAEAPVIQSTTGERSFTIAPESVEALPLADRNFATLATLAPGVTGNQRIGGGGQSNFMMDGVGTMDTGTNRLLVAVNVESIAEVKVLTSSYQAEYGRSSGLQITAVTKSGTNRFKGSFYDVERNSNWNAQVKHDILDGDPKVLTKQREWGYSIGGPIGKPGGSNKLFFFYAQEFQPRTSGNDVIRFRVPTELERRGDFSQTTDNNGNPYNLIRDASTALPCTTTDNRGCFQADGVLGRIPADRLYQTGLNILKQYPMPTKVAIPGSTFNFEMTRPSESLLSYQPAVRLDYQPYQKLRASFKYTGWAQRKQTILGTLPGFNDTLMQRPVITMWSTTVNYNLGPTMFLEGTFGRSANEQAGCGLTGGGPNFCRSALPVNPNSNRINAGLGGLPFLFPDANILNPDYYAYDVMNDEQPPIWDGTRIQMPPGFTWAGRVGSTAISPPSIPYPGFLNVNRTWDLALSLTKVAGRHMFKAGFYNSHSYKAQQRGAWNGTISFQNDVNNPIDSTHPFSNAALGIFTSYNQGSTYIEGIYVYNNTEGYIQDNWKVSDRLTLDYGVRLVHQQPQYDKLGQASNFLPEKWVPGQAPLLYTAMCPNNAATCAANTRQARNPVTGQSLGPNSSLAIGSLVPGTGSSTNGLFPSGQGIVDTTYTWPALRIAPRFGAAYDVTGRQRFVLRGGGGLFFDRPQGNDIYLQILNPPAYRNVTVRYGQLQSLGTGGLTTEVPPALSVYEYESELPGVWQWNTGMQMMLPWSVSLDAAYVGHHAHNTLQAVNLNAVDFGSAFLPQNNDPTLTGTTPASTAVLQDQMRAYRGYAAITQQWGRGWRTFHSLQLSFQRRYRNGLSFGFNDTISLSDRRSTGVRLQHAADGSYSIRSDQAEADRLLGTAVDNRHILKGHFVWDLPDLEGNHSAIKAIGLVLNDWRLSGIWTGITGAPYTVNFSYSGNTGGNVNLTGSNDYAARVVIVGDPGSGCSSDPYRQFNPAAFQGPAVGSVGLESGNAYLRECFLSTLDLSIARTIRLGGSRNLQLRVDMFNAPNSAIVTGRASTINLTNPSDPVTINNLPFDAAGNLLPARSRPSGAGVGVANEYQNARSIQAQVRFSF